MGVEMALLAATGMGALSSIQQGQQQKKAYAMQAEQAKMEAEANITDRTRALNEALASQNAMMGASGRTLASAQPLIAGQQKRYAQDVELIKSGAKSQSAQYKMAGKAAETSGFLNAASTGAEGAYKYSLLK